MQKVKAYIFVGIILGCVGMVGCSPKVTVKLYDATYQNVSILIDDEVVDELEPGDSISERVDEGHHTIKAIPEEKKECPWCPKEGHWELIIDNEVILTLIKKNHSSPLNETKEQK